MDRYRALIGSCLRRLRPKPVALEQLVQELPLEPGDARRLREVAAGALHQIREVVALERRDHLVLRDMKWPVGLRGRRLIRRGGRRPQHERQRLEVIVGSRQRDRARDHVAQLAHVARPVIALEPLERLAADLLGQLRRTGALEKHRDQSREIALALAQRRDVDLDDREPIVQIAAKAAARDLGEHVAMGRRDDADVELLGLAATERDHLARLEHAQELGLETDRQITDLVEEQRAAIRRGERTDALGRRTGERALGVTEQVALDQRLGARAAVERDERPGLPRRVIVDAARHQLLAGAALAEEQHRRGRLRRALEDREHLAHRVRAAVEPAEMIAGRRRDRDRLVGGNQLHERLADAQRDARRRDDLADRDAIDHRAVARA